jgi:photosystem II stability/assembly factor-like uncharacterized protein
MATTVLAGTHKGLFVLRSGDRGTWEVEGPLLKGWDVYHATVDPRDGSWWVAANSWVYGGTVQHSTDGGATWERSEGLGLPESSGLTLEKTWHVEPGHPDRPGELWLGAAPGALFRTDDGGATWQPVAGILEHPTRERWQPGAGGLCTHSIQIDPTDPDRVYIAISAAGAFRTDDGGDTWTPINTGVAADYLPDQSDLTVGQCVHKLLLHPGRPERLWQQNHCGTYRSDNRGDTWQRLDTNGLPSDFGFPIALDPADPDVAYVIPEEGAENRVTADGRLGVWRTTDAGASWHLHSDGLPADAWVAVLRDAMAYDASGVYFGTQSGSIFALDRASGTWTEAAKQLPPVLSVETA